MVARFSASIQTGLVGHPFSYTMGTGSFPGVKRPGRGVDHPPPSSAEVEGRVHLYICSPSRPSWPVIGRTILYFYLLTRSATVGFPYLPYQPKSVELPRNKDKVKEEFFLGFIIKHYAMKKLKRVVAKLHAGLIATLHGGEVLVPTG